jgi:hypothetical protein
MNNNKKDCYVGIFNKIDCIEDRIMQIKEQLASLKEGFLNVEDEEVCVGEIEAEKALLEIMNEAAIGALLDSEPQGDA